MNTVSTPTGYNRSHIHPLKLTLWVGIGSIIMMFAALTSAFIVRRSAGNWLEFKLPDVFFLNTLVIIASSVTLHWSYLSFKKGNEKMYKGLLLATLGLGLVFVVLQYAGWEAMTAMGATFTANPSSSFMFVIPGLHAAHVLGGIAALVVATVHAFSLPFKPVPHRQLRFELVLQYWHFVDILWVYLIIFFALNL
jgi:cytochrome c oxidase subunit III